MKRLVVGLLVVGAALLAACNPSGLEAETSAYHQELVRRQQPTTRAQCEETASRTTARNDVLSVGRCVSPKTNAPAIYFATLYHQHAPGNGQMLYRVGSTSREQIPCVVGASTQGVWQATLCRDIQIPNASRAGSYTLAEASAEFGRLGWIHN